MNRVQTSTFLVSQRRRGFTLVEVLISIAIALVLILGISQIFGIAQRTTGAGMQVLADSESNRGIQQMLLNDARGITNAVGDSPGLVMLSYPQAAFRNRVDMQQDSDGYPYTTNDPTNATNQIPDQPYVINDRIHRTDLLGFFARGLFTRRTGDGMTGDPYSLTSPTTSSEAFIWYGHLALPDNNMLAGWNYQNPGQSSGSTTGYYWSPGSGTAVLNPNNFFASDWILGREVMLLVPATASYYTLPHIRGLSDNTNPLWLLAQSPSIANDNGIPIYTSRYDSVDASIAAYRSFLGGTSNTTWWQGLTGWNPGVPQQIRYEASPFLLKPAAGTLPPNELPWLSAAVAQTAPIFVRGCTQFIVEFAGDYMTQDNSGSITSAIPDGTIDYVYIPDPTSGQYSRQIRWYGFPRDTTGTGVAPVYTNGSVLPVSTVLANAGVVGITPGQGPMRFERNPGTGSVTPTGYNWTTNTTASPGFPPNNGLPAYYQTPYLCAWGPDTDAPYIDPNTGTTYPAVPRPKMIRITIGIDDPTGHLSTQQIYQYVLNLP